MITIKKIAELADLSPTTVSIVLRGKAQERSISQTTIDKVMRIASENGYRPNVQAITLRNPSRSLQYRIVIFWAADYRAGIMIRFIKSIEADIMNQNNDFELLLKPYVPTKLVESMTEDLINSCHGIIICNAAEEDLSHLESTSYSRPLVLYNRYSQIYPAVTMDDKTIGQIPAKIFSEYDCHNPAIITSTSTFNGMNIRNNIFSYECLEYGMSSPVVLNCNADMEGGYEATKALLEQYPDTDCIFYSSDTLALGANRYFNKYHVPVPEQVKVIAVGNNEISLSQMSFPSISIIHLPIETVAKKCLELLIRRINYEVTPTQTISVPVTYIPGESCPVF